MLARSPLPSRECQRARGGRAADGPTAGVVEPGGVAGRRGRPEAPAVRVVVPVGPVALRDDGADAPAVGVVDPGLLRLGARDNRGHGSDRRGQDDSS